MATTSRGLTGQARIAVTTVSTAKIGMLGVGLLPNGSRPGYGRPARQLQALVRRLPTLIAGVPFEPISRVVQDLSAPTAHCHDGSHDRGIKSRRHQSGEDLAVDSDRAHLRVVTAEVDGIDADGGLKARYRLFRTGGRLRKGDKSLRTEAEAGESETIHGKAIPRNIGPFGVYLKRRRRRVHNWRGDKAARTRRGGRSPSAPSPQRS